MTHSFVTRVSPAIETAKNYHNWIFSIISKYLVNNAKTLEVGAGHGEYTRLLLKKSARVIVTDIDAVVIERMKTKLEKYKDVEFLIMDGIEPQKVEDFVDNIVAINVIEHLKDDEKFIRNCFAILKNGGRLIIFAPAFPCLFSHIDKDTGHFRRYLKKDMKRLLLENGFKIILLRYFNFIGFWGWMINKLIKSGVDTETTNFQVRAFDKLVWLFKVFDIFSYILGQSIIAVAEKR
jgi:SAM-dependent methyltransferase